MKKIFLFFSFFFLFKTQVFAYRFYNEEYSYLDTSTIVDLEKISATSVLFYNLQDDKIIYKKNYESKIPIASLTKIMTVLVAISNIHDLDNKVVMDKSAYLNLTDYAKAGFKIGEVVTYRDLLYGTLLPSGAEAAQMLALSLFGSIDAFVLKMNEMAEKLNLENTHYDNVVGMDSEENYSTLADLAKLLLYALNNSVFYEIFTARTYLATNGLKLTSTIVKPALDNQLNIDFILGAKTGFTSNAGLCLASLAEHNNIKYLLITAGSSYLKKVPNHIIDSLAIYNYFFENYDYYPIFTKEQELFTLESENDSIPDFLVKSEQDVFLYMPRAYLDSLQYKYDGVEKINSSLVFNDKIGEIQAFYQDKLLYSLDVHYKYKLLNFENSSQGDKGILFYSLLILFLLLLCYNKKR